MKRRTFRVTVKVNDEIITYTALADSEETCRRFAPMSRPGAVVIKVEEVIL